MGRRPENGWTCLTGPALYQAPFEACHTAGSHSPGPSKVHLAAQPCPKGAWSALDLSGITFMQHLWQGQQHRRHHSGRCGRRPPGAAAASGGAGAATGAFFACTLLVAASVWVKLVQGNSNAGSYAGSLLVHARI